LFIICLLLEGIIKFRR